VFVTVAGLLARLALSAKHTIHSLGPHRFQKFGGIVVRASLVTIPAAAGMFYGLNCQVEQRVIGNCWLEPHSELFVYSPMSAQIHSAVSYSSKVETDQELIVLTEPDLEIELALLDGQVEERKCELETARLRARQQLSLLSQLPVLETALWDVQNQRQTVANKLEKLVVHAPSTGVWMAPPNRIARQSQSRISLASWSGAPLDSANRQCWLERGDLVGIIGNPSRLEAVLQLPEAEIKSIRLGLPVRLRLNCSPGELLQGTVAEISLAEELDPRRGSSREREARSAVDRRENDEAPKDAYYLVRVKFDQSPEFGPRGSQGVACIVTGRETAAQWLERLLNRVLRYRD